MDEKKSMGITKFILKHGIRSKYIEENVGAITPGYRHGLGQVDNIMAKLLGVAREGR